MGLPVKPLDRLAAFSADEFERFILEWASDYLPVSIPDYVEAQQRGGAGDKGRDIIVFLDPSTIRPRRWHLYQSKHLASALGSGGASSEIGKVMYYTFTGEYTAPVEYWFVTHKGVTGNFQDLLDSPDLLRKFVIDNWDKHCAPKITTTKLITLTKELRAHIDSFDFSIFRAKQPQQLIDEHSKTHYHLTVFGLPLIEREPSPKPPSTVTPAEIAYIEQLYAVIGQKLGIEVNSETDFSSDAAMLKLFERSRLTFFSAEQLKELARDQMSDAAFFETLIDQFEDGLFHAYTDYETSGLKRLRETVLAAQSLQLGGHVLVPHTTNNDREGICHHLVNEEKIVWC